MDMWRICYFEKTKAKQADRHQDTAALGHQHGAPSAPKTHCHLQLRPQVGCDAK